MTSRPKRLLWIVNHRTLLASEVPAIEALGYEVYVPRRVPTSTDYRSTAIDIHDDRCATLPVAERKLLDSFNFYDERWSPSIAEVVDQNFAAIVVSLSIHLRPLIEAAGFFGGPVFGRAFGRELPFRYVDYLDGANGKLARAAIQSLDARFAFLYAYDAIPEVEDPIFRGRGQRVIAPLPDESFASSGSWRGSEDFVLFHCGSILDSLYYFQQYKFLKTSFGDLPHKIFGPQESRTNDPHVLPWMSETDLRDVFARGRVFAYTSREPRHLHFTPLEAMAIGMPVVYFKDSLLAQIVGGDDPGACASVAEMHEKLARLVGGDMNLAGTIASLQHEAPAQFRQKIACEEWREVFKTFGLPTDRT